jgi:hypothetical protein
MFVEEKIKKSFEKVFHKFRIATAVAGSALFSAVFSLHPDCFIQQAGAAGLASSRPNSGWARTEKRYTVVSFCYASVNHGWSESRGSDGGCTPGKTLYQIKSSTSRRAILCSVPLDSKMQPPAGQPHFRTRIWCHPP